MAETVNLVLVGGGHAHVQVLHAWARHQKQRGAESEPALRARAVLICDQPLTPYSGMVPGCLAGHYQPPEIHFDLPKLCSASGVEFIHDEVIGISLAERAFLTAQGLRLNFAVASIDVGSKPSLGALVAAGPERVTALKPISQLLPAWEKLLIQIRSRAHPMHVAMIGGGVSGAEVILALRERTKKLPVPPKLSLFQRDQNLLPGHNSLARRAVAGELKRAGIQIFLGQEVKSLVGSELLVSNPSTVPMESLRVDHVLVATQAAAPDWFRESGLPVDGQGFLQVDASLQVKGIPGLFGAGDCVSFMPKALPKAGVYPVRQGPVLIDNLFASLQASLSAGPETESQATRSLKEYVPQSRALALISLGAKRATASWGPLGWTSSALWHWKSRIDVGFMKKFGRIDT